MDVLQSVGSSLFSLFDVVLDTIASKRALGHRRKLDVDILKLVFTLNKIKRIILNLEEHIETRNSNYLRWINIAKDATYNIVDSLDDLELLHVKNPFIFNSMPEFVSDYLDSVIIQKILKQMNGIIGIDIEFNLNSSEDNIVMQHQDKERETSSILDIDGQLIGRDEVKANVIKLLLFESYDVIPIVGIGGVGKTTLAQHIFNNDDITIHFQLKIWLWASDFNEKNLTKQSIDKISYQSKLEFDLKIDFHDDNNWDLLQNKLKDLIRDKRFLLVLDDVWNDDVEKWLKFKKPFTFGQKGSKIIVTTREGTIAKMVTNNMEPVALEVLTGDDFWSLFKMIAFAGKNSTEYPRLESIGRDICKKLEGLPLAAKTVGQLLRSNLNETHWEGILNSELWKLSKRKTDIFPSLLLSYQHLPNHLKPCFLFFSLFPKAHIFDIGELVQMWGAHNWIKDEENKLMEDVGKEYVYFLLGRSMIQSCKGINDRKKYCVVHDVLHELALKISKNEYFCAKSDNDLQNIPKSVRHLSVYCDDIKGFKIHYQCLENLRTLIVNSKNCKLDLDVIFLNAKKLRLLKVSDSLQRDVPDSIKQLSHLRYLDFDSNQFRNLPDSFSTLHFLQVLVLKYCPLSKLPKGFNTLVNLRYLKLPQNQFTDSDITCVGNLCMLQKLHFEASNEMGHTITELKNMNRLRKLHLSNLERVSSKENAEEGNLKGKDRLDFLELCWNDDEGSTNSNNIAEFVIEGLQPPENIKDLRIVFYGGMKSPSWMENPYLSNIQHLEIIGCDYWNIDVSFGHLPHLVSLLIGGMKALQKLGAKFFGEGAVRGFPSLQVLHFKSLENWEEWKISICNHNTQIFPRLKQLIIISCSKLNGIPFQIPPSLSTLHLKDCPNLIVPITTFPPSITCLRISNCGEVCNSFNTTHLEGLTSLKEIVLKNCPNLTLLSPSLTAIEKLWLFDCPELKLKSWLEHLNCLRSLCINECPRSIESLLVDQIELPSSLEELAITGRTSTNISGNFDINAALPICMKNLSSVERFIIGNIHDVSLSKWIKNMKSISMLRIERCQELVYVDLHSLINLKYLHILDCPKLSEVGLVLPSKLELFCIELVSIVHLKKLLFLLSRKVLELKSLVISCCSELICFDEVIEDALVKLTNLRFLYIDQCCSCQSLPTWINHFSSLSSLILWYCGNIESLPKNGLPSSLKTLSIKDCPKLREQCKMGGAEWHKISHIQDIYIDGERIRQSSKIPQQRSGQKTFLRCTLDHNDQEIFR